MPVCDRTLHWDIFCNVIDNYGDIGVCWRLARQLVREHGAEVRLWVDALPVFQHFCPEIDPRQAIQSVCGIDVRAWTQEFPETPPGDVVIEAFACHLPERFVEAMARRIPRPIWINLDYLSAENWVSGCHALPSPHPRLPLTKYFFFPGFKTNTGGLLREKGLEQQRQLFCASTEEQDLFWTSIGQSPLPSEGLSVSLFAYENPAIRELLDIWSQGDIPVCCLAPATRTLPDIEYFSGQTLQSGDVVRRRSLEIRILPFVTQTDYDRLLWSCDINCVRGEDSFVRAQWAAKPFLWHIYPQGEAAHLAKLEAFLDLYGSGLSACALEALRSIHSLWNGNGSPGHFSAALWQQWRNTLPELRAHAEKWAKIQSKQEDLCSSLVRFCRSKV